MGIKQLANIITGVIRKARYTASTGSGVKSELSRTLKQFNMPTVFAKDIEQIDSEAVRNCFTDYALGFIRKTNKQNYDNLLTQFKPTDELWQMQEIVQKLNMCTDKRIKDEVELILMNAKLKSAQDFRKTFDKIEQILDCANTIDGKYSSLYRDVTIGKDFNEYMLMAKSKGNIEEIEQYKDYAFSDARKLSKPIVCKSELTLPGMPEVIDANIDKVTLEYIARNQDIKEYISTATKDDKMVGILYRKYLETQPKEIRYKLEDIYYHFGIHTFVDKGAGKDILTKLERLEYELNQQLKTSEGRAEFPNLLDITKYDPCNLADSSGGYTFRGGKYCSKISVNERSDEVAEIYRHESIHFHDKTVSNERPKYSEASKKDFSNGNLTLDNLFQIHQSRAEKIAHSARLDMAKVSQETKDELINDGLKPFYTEMESITEGNKKFLYEQFYFHKKDIESLIQHSKNGANEEFVMDLLKNRDKVDFTTIKYLIQRNPEYKFSSVEELLEHCSEYKETFAKKIQAFFDKTAVEKIKNNPYINKNELLDYIANHAEDRDMINEIINKTKIIMKISDLELLLGVEKTIRANQEWLTFCKR